METEPSPSSIEKYVTTIRGAAVPVLNERGAELQLVRPEDAVSECTSEIHRNIIDAAVRQLNAFTVTMGGWPASPVTVLARFAVEPHRVGGRFSKVAHDFPWLAIDRNFEKLECLRIDAQAYCSRVS